MKKQSVDINSSHKGFLLKNNYFTNTKNHVLKRNKETIILVYKINENQGIKELLLIIYCHSDYQSSVVPHACILLYFQKRKMLPQQYSQYNYYVLRRMFSFTYSYC